METKTTLKEHQKFNTIPIHIERFLPDKPIHLHYHDCVELVFCTGGYGLTNIEDMCLELQQRDLFIIGGKATHTMSDFRDFEGYRILFDMSLLDAIDDDIKNTFGYTSLFLINDSGYINYDYRCCITMTDNYYDRLLSLMNDLLYEYNYEAKPNESYMRALFYSICILIVKCFESRPQQSTKILFIKAVAEIVKHLNESINVENIAEAFGISDRYFRSIFAEHNNAPPAQFVIDMRLRRAKSLLACTNKSITEIAFSCGFYDSSHLVRVFKKHEGITPKEYRKKATV